MAITNVYRRATSDSAENPGPDAHEITSRLVDGLSDDEFSVPGHVVADVVLANEPETQADGSFVIAIEALTT